MTTKMTGILVAAALAVLAASAWPAFGETPDDAYKECKLIAAMWDPATPNVGKAWKGTTTIPQGWSVEGAGGGQMSGILICR